MAVSYKKLWKLLIDKDMKKAGNLLVSCFLIVMFRQLQTVSLRPLLQQFRTVSIA